MLSHCHGVLPKKCRYLKCCINLYVYIFSIHGDIEELGRVMSCFLYFLLWTNSEILQYGLRVCIWNSSDSLLYPPTPCSIATSSLGQLWGIEMLSVCNSRWFLKKHLHNLHCLRVRCQKTSESGFLEVSRNPGIKTFGLFQGGKQEPTTHILIFVGTRIFCIDAWIYQH